VLFAAGARSLPWHDCRMFRRIGFTSDAVPSAIADTGPFNCSNPPLPPAP